MANKRISELPTGSTPTGPELIEAVQGGVNVKLTAQEIADLGTGGLTESDLTASRTLTSAGATIQADNLNIIYVNSASPFDLTVDLLSVGTQITVINIGSATVTLIEGAGVTLQGTTIPILSGQNALIIYRVAATPDVYTGSGNASITVGTTTITSGTDTRVLYNNSGVVGEYTISGTGNVAMTTSPTFTTPNIGTATGNITGNAATVTTIPTLSGDVTNTGNTITVTKINDTLLSGLATGILKNTTGTGVPSIAVAGDFPALPYVTLTGTNTLTGTWNITSNVANRFSLLGTFTASADGDASRIYGGTLTGSGTSAHILISDYYNATITAGAANQVLYAMRIKPTFSMGGFANVTTANLFLEGQTYTGVLGSFALIARSGNTASTSAAARFEDGGGNTILLIRGDNLVTHSATTFGWYNSNYTTPGVSSNQYLISHNRTPDDTGVAFLLGAQAAITSTSGTRTLFQNRGNSYTASTGTAAMKFKTNQWTINQTGSASGAMTIEDYSNITYTSVTGTLTFLNYNPTVTSVTGTHYGVLIAPTGALNGFGTATPTATMHVVGTTILNGNVTLPSLGNKILLKEGSGGFMGQAALTSGTNAITVSGVTTSTRCFVTLVTPSGVTLTTAYQCACTSNTVTIQANVAAGTINTADNSTLNYILFQPAP